MIETTTMTTAHQKVWAKAWATVSSTVGGSLAVARRTRAWPRRRCCRDLALQDDGEEGGGERPADLAHDVDVVVARGTARVRVGVGGGDDRHHREPEADAPHEQGAAEERARVVEVTKAKGRVPAAMMMIADGHDPARAHPVGDPARTAHDQGGADALGRDQQPGDPGALAAHDLVVERQQEHRPEQGGAEQEHADVGHGEAAEAEQAQVEQRVLCVERMQDEADAQDAAEAKLTSTEVLVKLPVVPTSARE